MQGKSIYLSNKVLDYTLGSQAFVPPSNVYVALYTTVPTNDNGTGGVEVSGGDYARVELPNNSTSFPNATNASKSNGVEIEFPEAASAWGTVKGFGLYDAATGGNLLYFAALTNDIIVPTGGTFSFAIGQMIFTED